MTTIPGDGIARRRGHSLTTVVIRAGNQRSTVWQVIRELWHAHELVAQITVRDIRVRYTQAFMGFAWALLMPALIVGAGLLFRLALAAGGNGTSHVGGIASLAVKAVPWAFFSAAISAGTHSIIASSNLIGKVKFPREALPVAAVAAQAVDYLVGLVVVAIALAFLDVPMSWTMLWIVVLTVMLFAFTLGCALLFSCANLFYRDVKYIVQLMLNFGVFATPVFFEPQMLGSAYGGALLKLPLSPFIQGYDVALVHSHNLLRTLVIATPRGSVEVWSPGMLLYPAIVSMATLFIGLRIFRRAAGKFAEMA